MSSKLFELYEGEGSAARRADIGTLEILDSQYWELRIGMGQVYLSAFNGGFGLTVSHSNKVQELVNRPLEFASSNDLGMVRGNHFTVQYAYMQDMCVQSMRMQALSPPEPEINT